MRPTLFEIRALLARMRASFKYNRVAMDARLRALYWGLYSKLRSVESNYLTASTARVRIAYMHALRFQQNEEDDTVGGGMN